MPNQNEGNSTPQYNAVTQVLAGASCPVTLHEVTTREGKVPPVVYHRVLTGDLINGGKFSLGTSPSHIVLQLAGPKESMYVISINDLLSAALELAGE